MLAYQKYLQKKGIDSDVVRVPKSGAPSLQKPSISFIVTDSDLTSRLGVYPSPEGQKISETIQGKTSVHICLVPFSRRVL